MITHLVAPKSYLPKVPSTHSLPDAELLARFQVPAKREQAFGLIVQKYQEKVYSLVRKMVIDHEDADDVMQEVFIKVWKGLPNFRNDAQLFTWIYRIATNESLGFLKKKKKRFFLPIQDVQHELMGKLDTDPMVSGDDIQKKLQKALLKLPEKQRLVFNMKYFEELPYQKISDILGTSVGALKASYHLAVKKIEQELGR